MVVSLLGAAGLSRIGELWLLGPLDGDWWRPVTTQFFYDGIGYEVAALAAIALFGSLLERRHGWWAPLAVFLIGGTAGMAAVVAVETPPFAIGGNAAALALLAAWAMRDVLGRRRGREDDADLLGTLAIAALLVLLPVATREADPLAGLVGGVAGILMGLGLARAALSDARAPRLLTDAEVEAAVEALTEPGRLEEAQRLVGANAPGLQRILTEALHAADWFGSAHQAAVLDAAGKPDVDERLVAVRTLIAEETGVSMLIGVAVGFELARELMQDEE